MVDLGFWITSVESGYVHTQYVVQAPAVSPGPLSCNGVWNGAEVYQPAPAPLPVHQLAAATYRCLNNALV